MEPHGGAVFLSFLFTAMSVRLYVFSWNDKKTEKNNLILILWYKQGNIQFSYMHERPEI